MLSTLHAVHEMRAWIPCSLLSVSMVPFATLSLGVGAISWVTPKDVFLTLDHHLYEAYMRLCLFVFENWSSVQISLYGDVEPLKSARERAVIMSNHQSNVDWAVIMGLAARQKANERGFRVMVKHAIHYVPLFGWYIFQHGYIYVRRFGEFVSTPVRRQLHFLDGLPEPYWLLIFPEGTRFTARKPKLIEASQQFCEKEGMPKLSHVLAPRVGGLHLAREHLKSLDAVYDVTIGYGQTRLPGRAGIAPGMFEYVCGAKARRLCVHIKRFPVSEVPTDKQALKAWLYQRYQEKDRLLTQFQETGEFPDVVSADEPTLSIAKTLPSTIFFVAALAAPFFSTKVRTTYLCTMASFPLLIGWLHLRKCV